MSRSWRKAIAIGTDILPGLIYAGLLVLFFVKYDLAFAFFVPDWATWGLVGGMVLLLWYDQWFEKLTRTILVCVIGCGNGLKTVNGRSTV